MPIRRFALSFLLLANLAFAAGDIEGIGPFTGPEADNEAARLYERANNYVNNVVEGQYSYAYIQFHWKLAGANITRVLHAYPASPTAAKIKNGALVGNFAPGYFKDRVLERLEEKKVASFDAINCAIFLYSLETNHDQVGRKKLLGSIIQTLCRQSRWTEALAFPVLDNERLWLWNEVVQQAVIYHNDKLTDELLANTTDKNKSLLLLTVARSLAFRGESLQALEAFLAKQGDTPELRSAVFSGLRRRELSIQQAHLFAQPLVGLYSELDGIQLAEQASVDLAAFLKTIAEGPALARARQEYAQYLASLGKFNDAEMLAAPANLAASYGAFLVKNQDAAAALALPGKLRLTPEQTNDYRLALIEQLAIAGLDKEVAGVKSQLPAKLAVVASYHEFRGRMFSTENQLVMREHLVADQPIPDPNLVGQLICEWSLTPNRTLRGAAPWDAVVYKFAPGFANLPPPKDKKKAAAAGAGR